MWTKVKQLQLQVVCVGHHTGAQPLAGPRDWLWCRNAGGQGLMEQSGAGQSSPRILGGFGKQ